MMPNVTTGGNTYGLVAYLLGPGHSNEHTTPHVIAGDYAIETIWTNAPTLEAGDASYIAAELDYTMKGQAGKPQGQRREWDREKQTMVDLGKGPNHVWHCSLSLRKDEGQLSDNAWNQIAHDFVQEMGIADGDPRTDCKWVAIRHGVSEKGNDHIHIVVNRTQPDGRTWNNFRDFKRAQTAASALEQRYGLEVVESRLHDRGAIHDSAKEQNHARSQGLPQTYNATVEARVRAAATTATSEADFVSQLHHVKLRARPRFADGRTDVVTGYSVALPDKEVPPGINQPWRAGSKLAKDLGLRALRTRWEDTPHSATEAAHAWRTNWHSNTPTGANTGPTAPTDATKALRARLKQVNPTNPTALANASADIAGALAALSANPDAGRYAAQLRALARQVGHNAQLNRRTNNKDLRPTAATIASRTLMTAAALSSPNTSLPYMILSVTQLVAELAQLYRAANQAHTAARLETNAANALKDLNPPPTTTTQHVNQHAHANANSQPTDTDTAVATNPWLTPTTQHEAAEPKQPQEPAQDPPNPWLTEVHAQQATGEDHQTMRPTSKQTQTLDTLNPTSSINVDYDPSERANLPLASNMTSLAETAGLDPHQNITIYRGVPDGVSEISAGDYVTTNKMLAADYAGTGNVIEATVPAGHILDDRDEPLGEEYIYRPNNPTGTHTPNPWLTQAQAHDTSDNTAQVDEYAVTPADLNIDVPDNQHTAAIPEKVAAQYPSLAWDAEQTKLASARLRPNQGVDQRTKAAQTARDNFYRQQTQNQTRRR